VLKWIYEKLLMKRNRERHKVMKLEHEKAALQRKINQLKDSQKNYIVFFNIFI